MAKHVIRPYEEIVAANAAVRKILDSGVEARLRQIPGVTHVSVGVKVQGNEVTGELCIRVCVREKRPETELSATERIPTIIEGVPTDVTGPIAPLELAGKVVRGGTVITNRILGIGPQNLPEVEDGTFGFTATRNSDGKTVLVSNYHVLMSMGGKKGDSVYQPSITNAEMLMIPRAWLPYRSHKKDDEIGVVVDGTMDDALGVDVAIAKLDVSSCCRCCGLDFRDEIVGLSKNGVPPSNQIHGRRAALPNSTVFKVGMATDRTEGTVITDLSQPLPTIQFEGIDKNFTQQIQIAHVDTSEDFSSHGDSGSAIIDQGGYIVGLLFAFSKDQNTGIRYTFANHIAKVMQAMNITPNFKGGGTTAGIHSEARRVTFPMPLSESGAELYASTRARIEADPAGRWLWALAEEHREEIVTLVTTHRRVSVVWHRVGGPAIFANALNTLRASDQETLPAPPTGTLEEAMARVGTALATHGSAALRAALARHRGALLAAARGSRTLTDFLDRLRPHVHSQRVGKLPEDVPA